MHYYRHEIGHFRAATAALNNQQRYAYLEMIWTYYDKEKPLPDNPRKLALRIGATQEDIELILEIYFDLEDDGWHNKTCDKVLDQFCIWIEGKRSGGKASAAARGEQQLNTSSAGVEPTQLPTTQLPKKKDTTSSKPAASTGVPIQSVIDKWNIFAKRLGLPQVIKTTTTIKGQIRQRWADIPSLEKWDNFFSAIEVNDFLAGRAPAGVGRSKPFRSTLLWITKETNFNKIASGEYD